MNNNTKKYLQALDIIKRTLEKTPVYYQECEGRILFNFSDASSIRFYFDTTEKLEEIHTVDCDIEYKDVIIHKFRSVS